MRIDKNATLRTVPTLLVRKLLQHAAQWHGRIYRQNIGHLLRGSGFSTSTVVTILLAEGLVEKEQSPAPHFALTVAGSAFAMASIGPGYKIATATRALSDFLGRVHDVNADPYYLYGVKRVGVFGSYLNAPPIVNDVDIAYDLYRKDTKGIAWDVVRRQRSREARAAGRQFHIFMEELYWPETEVRLKLKARSRILSLHEYDDAVGLGATIVEVYPHDALGTKTAIQSQLQKRRRGRAADPTNPRTHR